MKHVAVDSDIFFFSVSQDKRDRNVRLASSLLEHIDNHPDIELVSRSLFLLKQSLKP